MEFKNRKSENLKRRKLKIIEQTDSEIIVDIERNDDPIEVDGTLLDASIFNSMQEEIDNANEKSNQAISDSMTAKDNSEEALQIVNEVNSYARRAVENNNEIATKVNTVMDIANNAKEIANQNSIKVTNLYTSKVDKELGKGLSTNDFDNNLLFKLNSIQTGAEVNVQSDWNITDSTDDGFIKNKPNFSNVAISGSYNDLKDRPAIPDSVISDSELSTTSVNPLQNKVVTQALNDRILKTDFTSSFENDKRIVSGVQLSWTQGYSSEPLIRVGTPCVYYDDSGNKKTSVPTSDYLRFSSDYFTIGRDFNSALSGFRIKDDVIPRRIFQKGYTGSSTTKKYIKIGEFHEYNSASNFDSMILNGRIGGWETNIVSNINAILCNRNGEYGSVIDVGQDVPNAFGRADIIATRLTGTDSAVYLEVTNYFVYDLYVTFLNSEDLYNGEMLDSYEGEIKWRASESTNSLLVYGNNAYVGQDKLMKEKVLSGDVNIWELDVGIYKVTENCNLCFNTSGTDNTYIMPGDGYVIVSIYTGLINTKEFFIFGDGLKVISGYTAGSDGKIYILDLTKEYLTTYESQDIKGIKNFENGYKIGTNWIVSKNTSGELVFSYQG